MTPRYRMPDSSCAAAVSLREALQAARCAAQLLVWTATSAEDRVLAEAAMAALERAEADLPTADHSTS